MIYLNRSDVETLLDMPTCIGAMRSAFLAVGTGVVQSPPRTILKLESREGFFGSMPVFANGFGSAAKVMTIYLGNHEVGLESHQGYVLLFSEQSGEPLALIEAGSITEIRTAAVSALATDMMAPPECAVLTILGSGAQARSHLHAMCCVRDPSRVQIWSRTAAHAEAFASWAGNEVDLEIHTFTTPDDAVAGAKLICTVTATKEPIVHAESLEPLCHVNAVGSFTPSARELDTATISMAHLVADSRKSALNEAGDILIPVSEGAIDETHIRGDLSELVEGSIPGRPAEAGITVFKSLGMAIEDLVAAKAVYDRAVESSAGVTLG